MSIKSCNLIEVTFGLQVAVYYTEGEGWAHGKWEGGGECYQEGNMLYILKFRKQPKMRSLLSCVLLYATIQLSDELFSHLKAGVFMNSTSYPGCPIHSNTRQLTKSLDSQRAFEEHIYIPKWHREISVISNSD